jgi:predicted esterase
MSERRTGNGNLATPQFRKAGGSLQSISMNSTTHDPPPTGDKEQGMKLEPRRSAMVSLRVAALMLVAGVATPSRPTIAADAAASGLDRDILIADSFEDGEGQPDGWSEGAPVPGVRYLWSGGKVADGKRALSLKKTANRYFPIAEWTRTVDYRGGQSALQVAVQVKAKRATKAIVDVQFTGDGGQWSHDWACYIGAKNDGDPPANHEWKEYSGTVSIPAGTQRIAIGLQIYGPGQVWFDQLEARYVDSSSNGPQTRDDSTDAAEPTHDAIAVEVKDGAKGEYLFVGPQDGERPAPGFGLVVVLPGGDGSADFHPFVRRIHEHALDGSFLVAQPLAVRWTNEQLIVWPTSSQSAPGMKFSTEEQVAKVVGDVASRHPLDRKRVYLLAWSSGGPAAYATLLHPESPATGGLIAMSVFKPDTLPPVSNAAGRGFYLLHSPEDRVCPFWMAQKAEKTLNEAAAHVTLVEYEGGHGWQGDVFGHIRRGIDWLDGQQ